MNTGALPPLQRPRSIFAILWGVNEAAISVRNEVDKTRATEHVERQALKVLRKGVENLKCDIMAYEVLLRAMMKDPGCWRSSRYPHRANNS